MSPLKVTLDTNCLYELESEADASALKQLAALGNEGGIAIQIPAIAASERQRDGGHLVDFSIFRERVERLGLANAELLRPLAYVGLSYVGWVVIIRAKSRALESRIHEILFPQVAFEADQECPRHDTRGRERWRNAKCDVLAMWCHINYGGELFVTRDKNFLKATKKSRLETLGARMITTPEEAVSRVAGIGGKSDVREPD